ncbi:uncharacterized protein F4807DRAFT_462008 [Annulohypoxylon truncatum]|uniref:uncharacterized protein n=1 Tax=Annulohypoxylon truncatum TaxID=327061 RepID=UPI002008C02C|nr:uncharacterized protein F4807DRAFT_462008 [Annulohypoxylon truncatum]KAI1208287.1 hypothetical protein F4807DRAFT_462008 [Annulohypoxylon truncatum]
MAFTFHSNTFSSIIDTSTTQPMSSTALNFFAALHEGGLKVYRASELGLLDVKVRIAGVGGSAFIEIGRLSKKKLVAVKRSRELSEPKLTPAAFNKHFDQLVLELRILGQRKMRKNPYVVNMLGVCIDELNGAPSLDLVYEYSSLGSLTSFLISYAEAISTTQCIQLILHVAKGLAAFHDLKICHGDVKTQNVLVFPSNNAEDAWVAKISDCGGSLIAPQDDPSAKLEPRIGTRLLNAPEIRKGQYPIGSWITIEGAMLTDIFSFGLLVWEVLNGGKSFLDPRWVGPCLNDMDIDSIEELLNNLPNNKLQFHGLEFIGALDLEESSYDRLSLLLKGALQDDAESRESMEKLAEILEGPVLETSEDLSEILEDSSSESLGEILAEVFNISLSSWTTSHSLYEVLDHGKMQGYDFSNDLPLALRERILSELKALATSKALSQIARAHAAMIVSECYTIGFAGRHDLNEVLSWINTASIEGLEKASLWHYRIFDTFDIDPPARTNFEISLFDDRTLFSLPSPLYLIGRIHLFNTTILQITRESISLHRDSKLYSLSGTFSVPLFNDTMVDEIVPLHLAAWFGDNEAVKILLQHTSPSLESKLGLNAVHYACLGGHLSTLQILLQGGTPIRASDILDITPLHFSIFFMPEDLQNAVELLLDRSTSLATFSTKTLKWDAHDLSLQGTALYWAVSTRYRDLVKLLAPHHKFPDYGCLSRAIGSFFWEIIEDLLPYFEGDPELSNDLTCLQTISRPFFHWIAHGREGPHAIAKTVELCKRYELLGSNQDGSTHLQTLVSNALTEDDLRLVQAVISTSSDCYIKQTRSSIYATPILDTALQISKHNETWSDTIREIASHYTIDELQDHTGVFGSGNYLATAVQYDSVVGARILLEMGVDVNKPSSSDPLSTAIFDAISMYASSEMISLLIAKGADLLAKHPMTGTSPLQWLIMGRGQQVLLDNLLNHDYPDAVYIQSLQLALEGTLLQLSRPERYRADSHEVFRYLLTQERFTRYINTADSNGRTLIQRASFALSSTSVRLLLDAQADANIAFQCAQGQVLPLQIACSQGRGLYAISMQTTIKDSRLNRERRSNAMDVAAELLRWHHARGDLTFQGITELHLACRMAIEQEIARLMENGYDPKAKGSWPGIEQPITPRDLLELDIQDSTMANTFRYNSLWETEFEIADAGSPSWRNRDETSSLSSISDHSDLSFH